MPAGAPTLATLRSVPTAAATGWRRFLAFSGPAYLVSVGYMDPGNWATDLEGGARFGYQLLWVLVVANLMAILLQHLCARLGIATGRDLAQSCRDQYPPLVNRALWLLCEIAIAACDLAEVLGAAIALKLLFGLPLIAGVLVAALDTLLILGLSRYGIQILERAVVAMVVLIGSCFAIQLALARPNPGEVLGGLIPRLNTDSLYVAIAMLGATVMPHNLYLYSSLVQTREIKASLASRREALRYNLLDSGIALNLALAVNAGILVLAAATFHQRGIVVTEIQQAHQLLSPLLGTAAAGVLFAVALLASGQSSTVTGTMAGQIVMEGFLNLRMRPWLRRLLTRLVAIAPAVATILLSGEQATYQLLILSQVILSLQLPFAIVPLIHFVSDEGRMGDLVAPPWLRRSAWLIALFIVALNTWLAWRALAEWGWLIAGLPLAALLAVVTIYPAVGRRRLAKAVLPSAPVDEALAPETYRRILVPLDHTDLDRVALRHAASLARIHGSTLVLLHVEEGVASQVYGDRAGTAEEQEGDLYLRRIAERMTAEGIVVETHIAFSTRPRDEIVRVARGTGVDLVVMGSHGHKGIKDIVFGSTINDVRHALDVPVLAVRDVK
jgi:manganese transport protein